MVGEPEEGLPSVIPAESESLVLCKGCDFHESEMALLSNVGAAALVRP